MKDKTKEEVEDQVLFSVTALANGGFSITRTVSPEMLGILELEIEICKGLLMQQAAAQFQGPVDPIDEMYVPQEPGEGH